MIDHEEFAAFLRMTNKSDNTIASYLYAMRQFAALYAEIDRGTLPFTYRSSPTSWDTRASRQPASTSVGQARNSATSSTVLSRGDVCGTISCAIGMKILRLSFRKCDALHPFIDGNGRAVRLLASFMLMRSGYLPIRIKYENRRAYYKAFTACRAKGDIPSMLAIFAERERQRPADCLSVFFWAFKSLSSIRKGQSHFTPTRVCKLV